jgi:L-fucose mutarotase/ribose pyranase (RbsD/FucU family)
MALASDAEIDAVFMQAFSDPDILTPEIAASIENALANSEAKPRKLGLLEHFALLVR